MINKLIDPIKKFTNKNTSDNSKRLEDISNQYSDTTLDYAHAFIINMAPEQRKKFKKMLDYGIDATRSAAEIYEVDPEEFRKTVKELL